MGILHSVLTDCVFKYLIILCPFRQKIEKAKFILDIFLSSEKKSFSDFTTLEDKVINDDKNFWFELYKNFHKK